MRNYRVVTKLFRAFLPLFLCADLWAAGSARHVVVVVWDGMRPDFMSERATPTLYKLASEGVYFQNHHPVYVSSTEVNGTALATGVYPELSGVIGNDEYRPAISASKVVMTGAPARSL
jgi:predicted AlkP superfamily pyrophosphatase or phosphodiesterase